MELKGDLQFNQPQTFYFIGEENKVMRSKNQNPQSVSVLREREADQNMLYSQQ